MLEHRASSLDAQEKQFELLQNTFSWRNTSRSSELHTDTKESRHKGRVAIEKIIDNLRERRTLILPENYATLIDSLCLEPSVLMFLLFMRIAEGITIGNPPCARVCCFFTTWKDATSKFRSRRDPVNPHFITDEFLGISFMQPLEYSTSSKTIKRTTLNAIRCRIFSVSRIAT